MSRWYIFCEPVIYHRCRGCGVKYRSGWVSPVVVVAIALIWFMLERMHYISPYTAIGLLLVTFVLTIWLVPYFANVHRKPDAEPQSK
jgi:hypothetical protein